MGFEGLTWPKRFALGAPMGHPEYFISFKAITLFGHLTPINPVPPVCTIGNTFKFAFITTVMGPGQNSPARNLNNPIISLVVSTRVKACSTFTTCEIIGSLYGLFLA